MLNTIVRTPTPAPGAAHPNGPSTLGTVTRRFGFELALEVVSLGLDGACAGKTLLLAFEATTGMVATYSVVDQPGGIRDIAHTAVSALKELHVPKDAEVDIACSHFKAGELIRLIKRMSARTKVDMTEGWASLLSFDRASAEIGRQVRGVSAYELASGWAGFKDLGDRGFFLECVVDQVLYWYHRRPAPLPGSKSPVERWAARTGVPSADPACS